MLRSSVHQKHPEAKLCIVYLNLSVTIGNAGHPTFQMGHPDKILVNNDRFKTTSTYISRLHAREKVSIKGKIAFVGPGPHAEWGLGITRTTDQKRLSGD